MLDSTADHNNATRAFRAHRHDVQNHLQLVKAYIQLNRTSDALRAVDRLAAWLTSLSDVQNQVGECAPIILWAAAQCPNVIVEHISGSTELFDVKAQTIVTALINVQQLASEYGVSVVPVSIRIAEDSTQPRVYIEVPDMEEIRRAWNNGNGNVDDSLEMIWSGIIQPD